MKFDKKKGKQEKGFSLRPTLVTSVTCIILLASGLVGSFAYVQSKSIINRVWNKLALLIARTTTEKTLGYLTPAIPFLKFSVKIAQSQILEDVKKDLVHKIMQYCYAALITHPDFTWLSFSFTDGDFIGAYKNDKNQVVVTWREIQSTSHSGEPVTLIRDYKSNGKGGFDLIEKHTGDYDPRTRPFWKVGLDHPKGGWSPTYTFWTGNEPGVAYVQPQINNDKLVGIWTVEYRLSELSDYLANLERTFTGPIALITDDGKIIATSVGVPSIDSIIPETMNVPEPQLKERSENEPKIQLITDAWNYSKSMNHNTHLFTYGQYLGDVKSFPPDSEIPWNVLTLMPEKELFAAVIAQAWRAFYVAIVLCLICIIIAALFFGHISKRLKEIAYEMNMIKNFKFTDRFFSEKPSFVREINMMNHATDSMKVGLQSFEKYVPVHLVRELIESGHAASLGGSKKEISILFTDLTNFTTLAEKIPPKELLEILEQYLQVMSDIIISNKGTVDKYVGDSIMAFWGAPQPLEQHPAFACDAALAMKAALTLLWKQWENEKKPLLEQRIGINTGNAIVGNIGSPTRMDYTAIGDHVNLASRLESLNKLYGTQILIGETTAKQIGSKYLLRPIDLVAVKGKSEGILIYELIGYTKDAKDRQVEAIRIYSEALSLYKNREFSEAAAKFDQANARFGGRDLPSRLLAERSKTYSNQPPSDDWSGYTILKDK